MQKLNDDQVRNLSGLPALFNPQMLADLCEDLLEARHVIKWALRNSRPHKPGKSPRWFAVENCFGVGSTKARELCLEYEVDPDEMIEGPVCESCETEYLESLNQDTEEK